MFILEVLEIFGINNYRKQYSYNFEIGKNINYSIIEDKIA